MKTSKKILVLLLSLTITFVISSILTVGLGIFTTVPFWPATSSFMILIWLINYFFQYYRDTYVIQSELKKLNSKPYKDYTMESTCQSCGHKQNVVVNLEDLEYSCDRCKRKNAIYVTFMTAAVTEPSSVNML
jgi:DNA-directed RNA polymerase subunit RPC12/RpoP